VNSPEKDEVGVKVVELQERIRRLKEEDAEFEKVQQLREEAAELERRKKMREEVRVEGVTRAVVKVPQPPPLPPIDNDIEVSKQKTRNMTAEESTKEVEGAKKKPKKSKKSQRITPLG